MNLRSLAFFSCVSLIFSGCAADKKLGDEKKKQAEPPKLVGRVMSKPSKKNFVLIEHYGSWKYQDGAELHSAADGREACLIVSGERLGPYVAADVESGVVDVGDAVYFRPLLPEDKEMDEAPALSPTEPAPAMADQ